MDGMGKSCFSSNAILDRDLAMFLFNEMNKSCNKFQKMLVNKSCEKNVTAIYLEPKWLINFGKHICDPYEMFQVNPDKEGGQLGSRFAILLMEEILNHLGWC